MAHARGIGEVTEREDTPWVSSFRAAEQGFRHHWPISPATRQRIVAEAEAIACDHQRSDRARLAAMRVLLMADALNVRRERDDIGGRGQELQAEASVLAAAMTAPGSAAALAELARQLSANRRAALQPAPLLPPQQDTPSGTCGA